jgi:hypothetical protein
MRQQSSGGGSGVVCRNFHTSGGCRFGNSCHYIHNATSAGQALKRPATATVTIKPPVRAAAVLTTAATVSAPSTSNGPSTNTPTVSNTVFKPNYPLRVDQVHQMWNFSDSVPSEASHYHNEDGVYFFGATGSLPEEPLSFPPMRDTSTTTNWSGKTFAKVLQENMTDDDYMDYLMQQYDELVCDMRDPPPTIPKEPCRFFLAGSCKFGNWCRNSHDMSNQNEPWLPNAAESTPQAAVECGICIEAPIGSLYGLMSHCECKFCLDCIREWRKEGVAVAKTNDQVR